MSIARQHRPQLPGLSLVLLLHWAVLSSTVASPEQVESKGGRDQQQDVPRSGAQEPIVAALPAVLSVGPKEVLPKPTPVNVAPAKPGLVPATIAADDVPLRSRPGGRYKNDNLLEWQIPSSDGWLPVEREWPRWVLDGRDLYRTEPPSYADTGMPALYIRPPRETTLGKKLKKLVRNRTFKEVRRQIKRRWREQFTSSNTMTFDQYDAMLTRINHIGKDPNDVDEFNEEHRYNETKDAVFNRKREGEVEIPLMTAGPLTITDAGSFQFDLGRAADRERESEVVDVGGRAAKPLFANKHYSINTELKVRLDIFDYTPGSNYAPFFETYGVEVQVDWLSDVLKREMVTTEFVGEFDTDGEMAGFFNIVLKARK